MRVGVDEIVKLADRALDMEKYMREVKPLVEDVRRSGDLALKRITEEFDGSGASKVEVEGLISDLDEDLKRSIEVIVKSVESFYRRLLPSSMSEDHGGVSRSVIWRPIRRVGIYVPRGYVSTLIMACSPAKVAGAERLVVVTPPLDGGVDPAMAYASSLIGAELYVANGVAGIAAMAFGTGTIPKVDKVVGPGNLYVQAAKLLVSPYVGIDGIEGPTELVVLAQDFERLAALEMASQLEHSGALGVLISTEEELLNRAEELLNELIEAPYYTVRASDLEEAVSLINSLAPEHASLFGVPRDLVKEITEAGVVSFLTPSSLVDYVAGPSHVLPTGGSARWRGILTPMDFMKAIAEVDGRSASRELVDAAIKLAAYEGFSLHARALGEAYGL